MKWKHYDAFSKRITAGIYQGKYPPSLGLFHCYTKIRMEIALNAFKCLKKYLPPKKTQEFPFRCSLHSFLTHVKSAIDNFTEEINLLYGIDPKLTTTGKTMSIEKLLKKNSNNRRKLKQANQQLFNEVNNASLAKWFTDLKSMRDEEAVHGRIHGKKWEAMLGRGEPEIKLGIKDVSDFATWCPKILEEANKFFERCYQLM